MSLTIVKNATCTFCGCVCDDIDLTVDGHKIVKAEPSDETYVTDYAEAAVADLKAEGVDVNGAGWQAPTVEVTAGGE